MTDALTPALDIAPRGLLKLIPPFWGKPRMAAILIGFLEELQDLEDGIWSVIDRLDVDSAPYLVLTWLAEIVGEPSRPADAEALRALIKGRILANRSSGTLPEIAALAAVLYADVQQVLEHTLTLRVLLTSPGLADPGFAASLLDSAAAGTVRVDVLTAGTFAWPDDADPSPPATGAMGTGTWSDSHGPY